MTKKFIVYLVDKEYQSVEIEAETLAQAKAIASRDLANGTLQHSIEVSEGLWEIVDETHRDARAIIRKTLKNAVCSAQSLDVEEDRRRVENELMSALKNNF